MRVADLRSELGFLQEHLPSLLVPRNVGRKDLDSDGAIEDRILGHPHDTHAALADFLDEAVVR